MAGTREILWRFGIDSSPVEEFFRKIEGLQEDQEDRQRHQREDEERALDDYADSLKEIIRTHSGLTDELGKQNDFIKQMAENFRKMADDARKSFKDQTTGGSRAPKSPKAPETVAEWTAATAKLRADIALEKLTTDQITAERQRILQLINLEIGLLRQKDALSTKELADLRRLTLERERQKDALDRGSNIGLTAGTREALASIPQAVAGAALGGWGQAIVGGAMGGGIVALISQATSALTGFVGEVRTLVFESDKLVNVQNVFERLSLGIGAKPAQFVNQLKDATHGLVDDTELMMQANRLLLQGVPLTSDQIVSLTRAVSELALVTGKDPVEAMNALMTALAGGRLSMLGVRLGLEAGVRENLNYAESLEQPLRMQDQFNIIMREANKQLAKTGDFTETAATKMKQAGVSWGEFMSDIGKSTGASSILHSITSEFEAFATSLHKAMGAMEEYKNRRGYEPLSEINDKVEAVRRMAPGSKYAEELEHKLLSQMALPLSSRATTSLSHPEFNASVTPRKAVTQRPAGYWDTQKKLAEQTGRKESELAQQKFDKDKANSDRELEEEKQRYDDGLVTFKKYQENIETIKKRAQVSEIERINAIADAQKKPLNVELRRAAEESTTAASRAMHEQEINAQIAAVDEQVNTQRKVSQYRLGLELLAMKGEQSADERKANQVAAQALFDDRRAELDLEQQALEKHFQQGEVSAQEYLRKRTELIAEESMAAIEYENARFKIGVKTDEAITQHDAALAHIRADATKKQAQIDLQTYELKEQQAQQFFDRQKSLLQSQLSLAQSRDAGHFMPGGVQVDALRETISLTEDKIKEDEKSLIGLDKQSGLWFTISTRINQNREAVIRLNQELAKTGDTMKPIADLLQRLATAGGGASWTQGLAQGASFISNIGGIAASIAARRIARGDSTADEMTGATLPGLAVAGIKDVGTHFRDLFRPVDKGFGKATDKLESFGDALEASIAVVSSWAQVASGDMGVGGGALSGGLTGLQSGRAITGELGKLSKGMGTMMAGPIGSAIGLGMAGIGAIVGIFSAKAKKKTAELARVITDSFNSVTKGLNEGSTSLHDALLQVENLRTQAIHDLSGRKGGQEQLDKILPQFDQTIAQLKAKQKQIFTQFGEALNLLRAPEAFREFQSSVDSIIKKYREYIDAGGDLANANEFLKLSFDTLTSQQKQNLSDAEMEAVQHALDYNDLLKQRVDLTEQQNDLEQARLDLLKRQSQAIEDVFGRGVLTRQRTLAMTKGEEIANIQKSAQEQLAAIEKQKQVLADQSASLDRQIDVTKYRLDAESKMFQIAESRTSLEMELVELQKGQIDSDMERLRALAEIVASLASGAAGGSAAAAAGLERTPDKTIKGYRFADGTVADVAGYSRELAKMEAWAKAHSGPINDINSPKNAGALAWLNMLRGAVPFYDKGGVVPETQLAVVHKGERIYTPDMTAMAGASLEAEMSAMMRRVTAESQILNMANERLRIESQILSMRMAEMDALMSRYGSVSGVLQAAYGDRGRMASGSFYGELG